MKNVTKHGEGWTTAKHGRNDARKERKFLFRKKSLFRDFHIFMIIKTEMNCKLKNYVLFLLRDNTILELGWKWASLYKFITIRMLKEMMKNSKQVHKIFDVVGKISNFCVLSELKISVFSENPKSSLTSTQNSNVRMCFIHWISKPQNSSFLSAFIYHQTLIERMFETTQQKSHLMVEIRNKYS